MYLATRFAAFPSPEQTQKGKHICKEFKVCHHILAYLPGNHPLLSYFFLICFTGILFWPPFLFFPYPLAHNPPQPPELPPLRSPKFLQISLCKYFRAAKVNVLGCRQTRDINTCKSLLAIWRLRECSECVQGRPMALQPWLMQIESPDEKYEYQKSLNIFPLHAMAMFNLLQHREKSCLAQPRHERLTVNSSHILSATLLHYICWKVKWKLWNICICFC